jgi:N-acetylglucosaminyl-diphospho-decaprenol L-rhamnosyltransferase
MRKSMPAHSAIIVTHNSRDCISACLRALSNFRNWEIILVENASTDNTVEVAASYVGEMRMLQNSKNAGFASALNQGARIAKGQILLLLNPDTVATSDSLDELARSLEDSQVGAVGGRLTRADGSPETGFTIRRFPSLPTMLAEVMLINRLWPSNSWNRRYRCLDLDYRIAQDVDQPAGACLAIKREAWEEIGGFDEGFFPVWFEDVDFCKRLRNAGWRIRYSPDATFVHSGGHSVNALPFADRQSYWYRNMLRYFSKHHHRWEVNILRAGVAAGLLLRALLSLVGFRPQNVSVVTALRAYWHAAWQYAIRAGGSCC